MIILDRIPPTKAVDPHALGFGDFEGIYPTGGNTPPPPPAHLEPPAAAELTVEFLAKQVRITSPIDRTIELRGHVDPQTIDLKAGEPQRRKLRGIRNAVMIDGDVYLRGID